MPSLISSKTPYRVLIFVFLILSTIYAYAAHSPAIMDTYPTSGNLITNPGFEQFPFGLPTGWILDPSLTDKGVMSIDTKHPKSGGASLVLSPTDKNVDKSHFYGVAQLISTDNMKGKRYRLCGSMRVTDGTGALTIAAVINTKGELGGLVFLTQDWVRSEYVSQDKYIEIGPDAKSLIIGCSATGKSGSAWFDDIALVEDEPLTSITPQKNLTAYITVNAGKVTRTIPRSLFGTNLEWIWNATGLWDAEKIQAKPDILKTAKDLGFGPVRFPGGFFSDYYHWRDGIGPAELRPSREHSPGADVSPNVFGTDELVKFCSDIGAEPLITINMITGTPDEAADWIRYCNQAVNPERAKNGSIKPYDIRFWEIGNEQYLKGDEGVGITSHLSTDEYIKRYKEWSSAMKKADPSIKLVAVGASNYGRNTMSYDEDWNKKLLQTAGNSIDLLSVHNAYVPADASGSNASFYEVYQAMFAYPILLKENLKKIQNQINTYAPAYKDHIKIAVTEWAPLFHILPTDKWIDHCKTLGSGIYAASAMKAFIETPGMDLANSFKLTEHGFMGWINFDGTPKPSYYALQMYTRHFGSALVNTLVQSPTFDTKGVSQIDAVKDVPYLEAISSLSKDKSLLYVIVINKHVNSSIKGKLDLKGFKPATNAKTWTMTAPSLDANNGKDLPDYPGLNWAKQIHAPQNSMFESGKPGTVTIRQGSANKISDKFEYTFPPISVTCIEMQRAK